MRDFRRVGNFLKQKYNGAVQVTMNQNAGRRQLIVADRNHKKPTKLDLVYFDESPDYCVKDLELGKTRPCLPGGVLMLTISGMFNLCRIDFRESTVMFL